MARWTLALAAALIGALLALPAEAQWKWRDKSGQTQYSDLPPPLTVPEQDILSKPSGARGRTSPAQAAAAAQAALAASGAASAPAVASASAPKTVESDLESKRAKVEADQAAKVKADEIRVASARAENCQRAKAQMRTFDSGVRMTHTNEKGEREFLDDKQRAEETRRTRDIIASDCK